MSKKIVLIAEIDPQELALRIAEGFLGIRRPAGKTAAQALAYFPDEEREGFMRAAAKAAEYISDCVAKGKRPS
jgi:hypothetical protein